MYRIVIIISLIFLIAPGTMAQEGRGVSWYDKATYDDYLKGNWNGVIKTGKEALKQGIDFYYLRMRLGIAFFSKEDYHKAIRQFRGALTFNPADPAALEYLYWCYLYTGREEDRQVLIQSFPPLLRKRLDINNVTGIRNFEASVSGFTNPDFSGLDYNPSILPGDNGTQTVNAQGAETAFKLRQAAGKKVSLEYGYRFLGKKRMYFYRDYSGDILYPDNQYRQHQLYGSLLVHPMRGVTVGLSANYLNLRTQVSAENYGHGNYYVTETANNWTSRLSFRGDMPFVSLYGGIGLSGLNGYRQLQTDVGITLFPAGNRNCYAGTGITFLIQETSLHAPQKGGNIIFTPFVGFKIAKPFWAELSASSGNLYNYQGENGWTIYNEMNPLRKSAGLNVIFIIFKSNITLNLLTSWSEVTSYYYQEGEVNSGTYPVNYHMLNFKGGIKWTFY